MKSLSLLSFRNHHHSRATSSSSSVPQRFLTTTTALVRPGRTATATRRRHAVLVLVGLMLAVLLIAAGTRVVDDASLLLVLSATSSSRLLVVPQEARVLDVAVVTPALRNQHSPKNGGTTRKRKLRTSDTANLLWTSIQDIPDKTDFYSASWFMSVPQFMKVDTSPTSIQTLEDGVFAAFHNREDKVRMSLDYLDVAVEHLSHWWRLVGVPHNDAGYYHTVRTLASYIARRVHSYDATDGDDNTSNDDAERHQIRQFMNSTIAVVAFSSNVRRPKSAKGIPIEASELSRRKHVIAMASLGATLASLIHVGVGRIVVVGSNLDDRSVVHQTFQQLVLKPPPPTTNADDNKAYDEWFSPVSSSSSVSHTRDAGGNPDVVVRVHETDLTFAWVSPDMVNTTLLSNNVPRGTLAGLQRAFQRTNAPWTQSWLGNNRDMKEWKYVYYTESDTLLQTRPSVLRHLQDQLDVGNIVAPHRLQLIAYQEDVPDYSKQTGIQLIPTDFKTPVVINSGEVVLRASGEEERAENSIPVFQHCCDALEGRYRPGRDDFPYCGDAWYRCGWKADENGKAGNHSRLLPYALIRLTDGTGITTLSGTEHGRRCHPSSVPCARHRQPLK